MKKIKKFSSAIMAFLMMFILSAQQTLAQTGGFGRDIYTTKGDNILAKKVELVVRIVGGVGGAAFTLAVLIISLIIMFGSISPANKSAWWKALISVIAAALIFFSAYALAPAIANMAG